MTILDCRLISPHSLLRPLILDPMNEGIYALFHARVVEGAWTNPYALMERMVFAMLGATLLCPLVGTIALQVLIRTSISYQEALHQAITQNDHKTVQKYLKIGVSPNNLQETKPLLFQTKDPEILQALIDHGADTTRRYRGQYFYEYLFQIGLDKLGEKYFVPPKNESEWRNIYYKSLEETMRLAVFLGRMGCPCVGSSKVNLYQIPMVNFLEQFIHQLGLESYLYQLYTAVGIEKLMEFEEELHQRYPKMNTGRIWAQIKDRDFLIEHQSYLCRVGRSTASKEMYKPISKNPLETIVATQDGDHLRKFIKHHTFEEVYEIYLDLKTTFPKINTDWIWDTLYEIPDTHYTQAKGIQQEEKLKKDPPVQSDLRELITLFDQINFRRPKKDHYVPKEALKETLDSTTYHTPESLKKGLLNIIHAITTGQQVYQLTQDQRKGYWRQVQWILYYLKQGKKESFLQRDKANVLIEIAKTCLMCPGRYNEVFDLAIKRLRGDPIIPPTFERQLNERFADLRSRTLTAIAFKEAKGCPHARENLVFHLHREKSLVETRPEGVFTYQGLLGDEPEYFQFTLKSDAKKAFDREYTPSALAQVIVECVREGEKKTQRKKDFNEILLSKMVDAYGERFPKIQALQLLRGGRLSKQEAEQLFKPIDPGYTFPGGNFTAQEHVSIFKHSFLGAKIRPLDEKTYQYLLPEVIHPLILGQLLCDLGHLRQKFPFKNANSGLAHRE